jgi:hypothetical protein
MLEAQHFLDFQITMQNSINSRLQRHIVSAFRMNKCRISCTDVVSAINDITLAKNQGKAIHVRGRGGA